MNVLILPGVALAVTMCYPNYPATASESSRVRLLVIPSDAVAPAADKSVRFNEKRIGADTGPAPLWRTPT